MLSVVFSLLAISMVRNIKERNVEKLSKRRVGRCLGLREIAPVIGSIIICCSPVADADTMMPLVEPGAAIYGSRFALGALSWIVIGFKLRLRRCFRTRMSSCEKAHSSAERSDVVVDSGWVLGGGSGGDWLG